ncbi:hypothetical protein EJB05_45122, partial [Eragrostis curvula]
MKPVIDEAIVSLLQSTGSFSSLAIADLGCSSGPNALANVSAAVDAVFRYSAQHELVPPEVCVLLNDLPDNDFNNIAKKLVEFQQRVETVSRVMTCIVPGSFYKRLFTSNSLHLVTASNSLHYLSEAPEDLKRNKIPLYYSDEGLTRARRPMLVQAYGRQFRKDFSNFLNLRAKELVPGGQMVVSMLATRASQCIQPWDILGLPLNDMASRGVISREMLDLFYVPSHAPCEKELRDIIEDDDTIKINKMQVHELMTGIDKDLITPKMVAYAIRAMFEPIMVQHFGPSGQVMDEFVRTLEHQLRPGSQEYETVIDRVFLCVFLTKRT